MLSDDELVEQILLGNENAAEELIKRYYISILRYCRWHCSNLEKAEDLTQETFLKLFKNLSGYKGKKKFKAYLYTIANHLCIDESRKVEFSPLEDEENTVHEYNDIVRLEDRAEISYFLKFLSSEQREAVIPVSYTHLDVYKRQRLSCWGGRFRLSRCCASLQPLLCRCV